MVHTRSTIASFRVLVRLHRLRGPRPVGGGGMGWGAGRGLRGPSTPPRTFGSDRGGHIEWKRPAIVVEMPSRPRFTPPPKGETPLNPANGSFPLNFVMSIKQIVDSR